MVVLSLHIVMKPSAAARCDCDFMVLCRACSINEPEVCAEHVAFFAWTHAISACQQARNLKEKRSYFAIASMDRAASEQ